MLHFSRWKTIAILIACVIGVVGAIPNLFEKERVLKWPFPFNKSVNLGLDLQGGAYFLMSIDTSVLRRDWLADLVQQVQQKTRAANIARAGLGVRDGRVVLNLQKPEDMAAAEKELRTLIQPLESAQLGGTITTNLDVRKESDAIISLGPTEPGLRERESQGIGASIETVRRRLDPDGTKEMNIVRQGRDRILIQIPGVSDPVLIEGYKKILNETAKMTFHVVHPSMTAEDAKTAGRAPSGFKVFPSTDRTGGEELLEERPLIGGDQLARADPSFDQANQPALAFQFKPQAARTFGKFSAENIGRRFAIVLDGKVLTAPVIRSAISDGNGQITGNFTVEEVTKLSIQLRSGALPAPLKLEQESTVGASLGADSIRAGKIATIIGALLVVAFMLFAYGLFGIFSIIAVAINIAMIMTVMSWLGASLTLPGIAGILLTIGMAVDANVLIYERIREELRNKSSPLSAIEKGFDRAFGTIIDANLTTLIAGIAMFALGSGPIKGFAVTLSLGILTTVFTAFTVTRMLVSWWLASQKNIKKLEAPI
jgi:protein-export membrane protein SecD